MTLEEFEKFDKSLVTYENVDEFIDKLFPEYVESEYYEKENKELKYIHLGSLSMMALEDLDIKENINLAIRLVKLTNYILNNFGEELSNLFGVEVLESLAGSRKGANLAREYLHDRALDSFHATTLHYHTEDFLDEYFKVFSKHPITAADPESMYAYMIRGLRRPRMNPPVNDLLLSDVRVDLELDEDLIAGTLSYLVSHKHPQEVQIKNLRNLRTEFDDMREKIRSYKFSTKDNEGYAKELLAFIDDLERLAENTSIWYWNNFHK